MSSTNGRAATIDTTEHAGLLDEVSSVLSILEKEQANVLVADTNLNLVYVNEAASRAHGYEREQLQQMSLRQLVAPEQRESALPHLDMLAAGHDVAFQTVHCRRDGSRLPIEVHARVVESAGGKIVISIVREA